MNIKIDALRLVRISLLRVDGSWPQTNAALNSGDYMLAQPSHVKPRRLQPRSSLKSHSSWIRSIFIPRDKIALLMKPLARHVEETGTTVEQLVAKTGLDAKLVKSIVTGNYTPSPAQRQRLAAALGVSVEDIDWAHSVPVQHLRGNGPQSGRST
jgi:hypothetical protein